MNKSYENNISFIKNNKKIGVLGAGNMGGAIIKGLCGSGFSNVAVYDPNAAAVKALRLGLSVPFKIADSVDGLIEGADILILAIKPQMFSKVLSPYREEFLKKTAMLTISIAAGKKLSEIAEIIGDVPTARVMPNLAAAVGESMSGFCLNKTASEANRFDEYVTAIFETVGKVVQIEEEHFSAFSAIAGCSPAFTMLFIDSLAGAAVRYGIPKKQALEIAVQAVRGTAILMESYDGAVEGHPRVLIDNVCSPGGTTVEGVAALQQYGLENVVAKAVEASYNKDKSM